MILPTQCEACSLCRTATQYVAGTGNPICPELMVIGEAPGAEEDRRGMPFVGPAGTCLEEILSQHFDSGEQLWITNTVKHRPPANRTPTSDELEACWSWLEREIVSIQPRRILCCGKTAYTILAKKSGLTPVPSGFRGQCFFFHGIPVRATWHPSYVIRNGDIHDPKSLARKLATEIAQDIRKLLG